MSPRLRTIVIAVTFGLLATLGVALYVNSVKASIVESGEKTTVLVAAARIPAGTPVSELSPKSLVKEVEVPRRYQAEGALSALDNYGDRVIVSAIGQGEQLTIMKLRSAKKSEVAHKLSDDKIAVSVPVDDVKGVGGQIQVGDYVVLLATFEPGPGGRDISRVLLRGVEVLAVSGESKAGVSSVGTKSTITVAVSPDEAEKLVFAEEKGKVWVGLTPAGVNEIQATQGHTVESVFR